MTLEDAVQDSLESYGAVQRGNPQRAKKMLGVHPHQVARGLERFGLGEWVGQSGGREPQADYYRVQRSVVWEYPTRGDDNDTEIGLIQVRSVVYTKGSPPDHLVERVEQDALRIVTLWDTGPYSGFLSGQGSMAGFNAMGMGMDSDRHAEIKEVGHDEVDALGIPEHYLEVYDEDGNIKFDGHGTYDPFQVTEREIERGDDDEPGWQGPGGRSEQYAEWRIGKQTSPQRGIYYEFQPQTTAGKNHLKESHDKDVRLNGLPIVSPDKNRGTIRLKHQYASGDTYAGNYSRRGVINNTGAYAASIAKGGLVYKVYEDEDTILLRTSKPSKKELEQIEGPDDAEPGEGGPRGPIYRRDVSYTEATTFTVDEDNVFGDYAPEPTDVRIERGRYL